MAQNHVLSYVSCLVGWSKNLVGSCESSWKEDAKIVIDLSLDQILSEKMKKMLLPKKLGNIDVLRTVCVWNLKFLQFCR